MVDVLIIGGGPAGLTAAVYAKRAGRSVLVLEKEAFGGQIAESPKVENFPTIRTIDGAELTQRLLDQVVDLGVDIDIDEVVGIEKEDGIFKVHAEYGDYEALSVIICAGCKHREIKAKGIEKFIDNGISYCAVCDGAFYEGKDICLIGDANTALQYALLLSNICHKVYLCTLFDRFFGEQPLVDSILEKENIEVHHNVLLDEVKGNDSIEEVVFLNKDTNNLENYQVDGLFIAIGQVPANDAFKNLVDLDEAGYIKATDDGFTKTEGLFVAGDCRTKKLRQVATAVGDAANAANNANLYLLSIKK